MIDDEAREKRRGGGIGEGIRAGIGVLNAFREAIEETIQDAVDRGEMGPERAKRAMQDASQRLQEGLDEARERFDLVPRREYEALRAEVEELRRRVEALENPPPTSSPDDSGILVEPA